MTVVSTHREARLARKGLLIAASCVCFYFVADSRVAKTVNVVSATICGVIGFYFFVKWLKLRKSSARR